MKPKKGKLYRFTSPHSQRDLSVGINFIPLDKKGKWIQGSDVYISRKAVLVCIFDKSFEIPPLGGNSYDMVENAGFGFYSENQIFFVPEEDIRLFGIEEITE